MEIWEELKILSKKVQDAFLPVICNKPLQSVRAQ